MSNISDKLHDHLSQEFEYDRANIFEFGWCNIIEAEDRLYKRRVKLYVPREDVWDNGAARKLIKKQFKAYYDEKIHECLPEAIDLLEGKNAKGSIVLVTSRTEEANLMDGERKGSDISWLENDNFSFPEKLGAVRKLVEAVNILHGFGMVHGALGHQTVSCVNEAKSVILRIELLNFSDVTSDDPTASLFFEPAFTAPELFEGGPSNEIPHKSKETDVYSLGKFILYFLLGPVRFIKFFSNDDEDIEDPQKVISTKMSDHILWTNIAHSNAEHDSARLEKLSNDKLSAEIAEFLAYTISSVASVRPDDAQMFFHGLSTIMGGEIDMPGAPAGGHWMEENPKSSMMLPMIGAAAVVILIGGYFFMTMRAEKLALETQTVATAEACGSFFGEIEKLKDSRVMLSAGWANVDFAKDKVNKNGRAEDTLAASQKLCEKGNADIAELKKALLKELRAQISAGQESSAQEGTDFTALDIEGKLEKAQASVKARQFGQVEAILGGLADEINEKRGVVLSGMLEKAVSQSSIAQNLLNIKDVSKAETNMLTKAGSALALDANFAGIEKKNAALVALTSFNMKRLSQDANKLLVNMTSLADKLEKEDAVDAGVGFGQIQESLTNLQAQGLPFDVDGFQDYYGTLSDAAEALSEIETYMGGLEAELPRLTQNIVQSLDIAKRNGWLEESQVAILNSQFNSRESFSIYKDWSFLGKLDTSLNSEILKLETQWAEGKDVCTAMLNSVEQIENMETTLVWAELSEILTRIRSVKSSEIGREHFAECEQGYALYKRGNIELQAKELFGEIKQTTTALTEKGIGGYIEEFVLAETGTAELKDINIPQSQESYDTYASKAYLILANLDNAEKIHSDAVSRKNDLTGKYDDLNGTISTTTLGNHPEYLRTIAELIVSPDLNILDQNAQLQKNIEILEELVRKFENGTLINCTFDNGFEMLPILSDAEKLAEGLARINKSVKKSGVAYTTEAGTVTTFCVNSAPVSHEELLAFGEKLKVRQADVKAEIANATSGSAGAAVNISYWLATRYAEWVGKKTKQQVCVAPAIAAVLAELSAPDKFETISTGELFKDNCGSQSAIRKKLVLYDVEDTGMTAGCVSNNSLRPELSFRLAAGDICSE